MNSIQKLIIYFLKFETDPHKSLTSFNWHLSRLSININAMNFEPVSFYNQRLHVPNYLLVPVIPGDGIGPEIWKATQQVIDVLLHHVYQDTQKIQFKTLLAGQSAFETTGSYLPQESLDEIAKCHIAIKGPLQTPVGGGIRSLNVALRKTFDLYACVRPIRWFEGVKSPVRLPEAVDMVIFRENTEDIYAGIEWDFQDPKVNQLKRYLVEELGVEHIPFEESASIGIKPVSQQGSERLVLAAIEYAIEHKRHTVTLVHKGNIMKFTEGRFRDWGYESAKAIFGDKVICWPDIQAIQKNISEKAAQQALNEAKAEGRILINDCITDAFFQQALIDPQAFDVIATTNLNGDYISDALAAQVGGIGISPGANINYATGVAIFEATHGTAPAIVGKGLANPTAMLLSVYMCLNYVRWQKAAKTLLVALKACFKAGECTPDLASQNKGLSTQEFADELCKRIVEG